VFSIQPSFSWCDIHTISSVTSAGWIRLRAGGIVLKHSSFRGSTSNCDWSILLWQEHMQKPNISSGSIRNHLWKNKRDIHRKTRTLCLQWCPTMHGCKSNYHRATTTKRTVSPLRSILLADFWRVEHSYQASN